MAHEPIDRLRATIEHTLLAADATRTRIEHLCEEAHGHRFAGVCVNPIHVEHAVATLAGSGVRVITVVGFPLGATFSDVKALECEQAALRGADEIDMVMDIGAAREGRWDRVEADISAVVARARDRPVKVILETAMLDDPTKQRACEAALASGAAFVKTCTGFGGGAASEHDVALMRAAVGNQLGVKASGGIRTCKHALKLLRAGATRLGTSAGPALVRGEGTGSMNDQDC